MTDVVTTDGDRTITYEYYPNGQFNGTEIDTSGPNGYIESEFYDATGKFSSGGQFFVTDNGQQYETVGISYNSNWVMYYAEVHFTSDANPLDSIEEDYGSNWQLNVAYDSTTTQTGNLTTTINDRYNGSWSLVTRTETASDPVAGVSLKVVNGSIVTGIDGGGSAAWTIEGVSGSETWTTGTHAITLAETANPGTAPPLVTLTDVTFDNTGAMSAAKILTYGIQGQPFTQTEDDYDATWHLISREAVTQTAGGGETATEVTYDSAGAMSGGKIFTYGIQGQAFTQTEEDYDANWHLTSWTGSNPTTGFDQTVNYTVGSTA